MRKLCDPPKKSWVQPQVWDNFPLPLFVNPPWVCLNLDISLRPTPIFERHIAIVTGVATFPQANCLQRTCCDFSHSKTILRKFWNIVFHRFSHGFSPVNSSSLMLNIHHFSPRSVDPPTPTTEVWASVQLGALLASLLLMAVMDDVLPRYLSAAMKNTHRGRGIFRDIPLIWLGVYIIYIYYIYILVLTRWLTGMHIQATW